MAQTNEPLLSVKGLKQYFPASKKFTVRAVDVVLLPSIFIRGGAYGLVGDVWKWKVNNRPFYYSTV